jgi:hypothetical protein
VINNESFRLHMRSLNTKGHDFFSIMGFNF